MFYLEPPCFTPSRRLDGVRGSATDGFLAQAVRGLAEPPSKVGFCTGGM